jgi:hypothetical protein
MRKFLGQEQTIANTARAGAIVLKHDAKVKHLLKKINQIHQLRGAMYELAFSVQWEKHLTGRRFVQSHEHQMVNKQMKKLNTDLHREMIRLHQYLISIAGDMFPRDAPTWAESSYFRKTLIKELLEH